MKDAIVVIQCRMDSTRCPGKILRQFEPGVSMLEHIINRNQSSWFNIVVATTDRDVDDPIARAAARLNVSCFRGDYANVIKRIYDASDGYNYVIRITGDDPFTDVDILNNMAAQIISTGDDYIFAKGLLRGVDCDIFKRAALKIVLEKFPERDIEHIEHFMLDMKTRGFTDFSRSFSEKEVGASLSVDTESDWILAKLVYNSLKSVNKKFTTFDIVNFIARNQELKAINHCPLVSVYTVHKNYNRWLDGAVQSVLSQTFNDYEYILVDYGSDHDGAGLQSVMNYINNDKINVKYHPECENFIDAIKVAGKYCKSKYVIRVDADDVLHPNALKTLVDYIQENPFYAAVLPSYREITETGDCELTRIDPELRKLPTCALIDRKRYDYVKYAHWQEFRDGVSLFKSFDDYGFAVRYLKDSVLFDYRIHKNSLTNNPARAALIKEHDEKIGMVS